MPKTPIDYSNACIYKICCNDSSVKDVYVGSTTNLGRRRGCHKANCHNGNIPAYNFPVYQFIRKNGGWDNWSVVKLQDVNSKEDLFKTERMWVEKLGAALNKNVPSRSQQEWIATNREKVNACHRQYYQDHKESALEYQKRQYQQYRKERVTCPCGSCVVKRNLPQHHKSKKHLNFLDSQK